jgi:hypothetical protein
VPPRIERQKYSRGEQREIHGRMPARAEQAAHFEGGVTTGEADECAIGRISEVGDPEQEGDGENSADDAERQGAER